MIEEVRLARIWNSLGVRLPKRLLERYGIRERVRMELNEDAIVLRPVDGDGKLSWKETFAQMAMDSLGTSIVSSGSDRVAFLRSGRLVVKPAGSNVSAVVCEEAACE